jgi:hypothetical protein
MNLATAQGAVSAITVGKTKQNFKTGAFASYFSGHDGKHRSSTAAYGHNHDHASGNSPSGYYQKQITVAEPTGALQAVTEEKFQGWGKPKVSGTTMVAVMKNVVGWADLTEDDECNLLWGAINSAGKTYCQDPRNDGSKFCLVCAMPANFNGSKFEGGGKTYPKRPIACDAMVLVIRTGGANVQLVTHYPDLYTDLAGWTQLA